jgi:hypothetical protein
MGHSLKLSDRDKRWAQGPTGRKTSIRPQRRYFLIVCEGEKTEPNYFRAYGADLPKDTVLVDVCGEGMNTLSLVARAAAIVEDRKKQGRIVDRVWVVFDRDSFEPDDFDNAIAMARQLGYGAAWSNEAFELWYLLHFQYRDTGMDRGEFQAHLARLLGRPYRKNDTGMYRALKDRLGVARRHASRLVRQHDGVAPHTANPCTRVHELVAELEKLRPSLEIA